MADGSNTVDGGHLLALIERVEKLEEEKRAIADDIKDVLKEAKSHGFDPKIIKAVIKRRAEDAAKREEFETILDLYLSALGELADLPLGRSAVDREFGARAQ